MTDANDLGPVLEAILFVANEPVSRERLLEVFEPKMRDAATAALDVLVERYRESPERGIVLDEAAGGVRFVTRPDLHGYLRRFYELSGNTRLSMAALETLAIIAYRQPVTAPEIQELRGVSSSGVLKTLLERRLVRIAGRKEVVGKPFLYGTTREFLMRFGLRSLKDLPPLEQFEELYGAEAGEDDAAGEDHEESVLQQAALIEEEEAEREAEQEAAEDEAATVAAEADAESAAVDDDPDAEAAAAADRDEDGIMETTIEAQDEVEVEVEAEVAS